MKRILSLFLSVILMIAALPLSLTAFAADDVKDGAKFLDEIIVEFFDISMFPGKEKQYNDEVAKILKDGLDIVTDNVYVVKAEELNRNPNAFLNRFKNSKYIKYIEPNYILETEATPNDPSYSKNQNAVLTALNAPAGWDIVTSGGPIIAVVDTGYYSHTDLPKAKNGYSAVTSLIYGNDAKGHGTNVAGVVGAIGNNGVGGTGLNWNANIMAVKVDDAAGVLSVANTAKGIIWAADNGAKIINLSLGSQTDSVTLKNAINYAYNKGCAIFAAAGNEGVNGTSYPARYSNVLAVGSSSNGTTRSSFSNYGAGLDVVGISSYYTTAASGGYGSVSGTSFASPQAAALASLMWSINPDLTNDDIYSLIRQNAKPLGGGYNEQTGYGLIDIGKTLAAVQAASTPSVKDITPPVLTLKGNAVMEIKQGTAYAEPGYTAIDDTDGDITNKVTTTGTVNVNTPGVYRIEYTVSDVAGNKSTTTRTVEVILVDNTPPVLTLKGSLSIIISQDESFVEPGYTAIDGVDGDVTSKVVVTGNVDETTPGVYELNYTVSDAAGNTASATREVEIKEIVTEPPMENPLDEKPSDIKSFLIEAATGTRNDYNGSVGYEFECLEDMTVSYIGRPLNGTMNYTHEVYLWEVKTGKLLASAEVKPNSPLDSFGFKVAQLDKEITLKAGEKYRITSAETKGGDKWFDISQPNSLIPNVDCTITTAVYTAEGAHTSYPSNTYSPGGNKGYVGVTFYYNLDNAVATEPEIPEEPKYETPPIITLNGSVEVTLFVDDEYTETGYTAVDCYGVDLTGAVRVTNNINIWTPGIYKIDYEVMDSGGNTARETRTVFVVEREVESEPPEAPKLTIIGSDPIILHLDSGTPYEEQGAYAYDEIDGDISGEVQITGSVDRDTAGTYILTYSVVNSAGLEATATRTVRILAPDEVTLPRQTYNFSGQGKAVSTVTHKNVICNDAGYMDFAVTSIDKNMTIKVEVKKQKTGEVVFSDTYTGVGGTQFWADAGTYDVNVTIAAGNGNSKYGVRIVTPEVMYLTFEEEEVPLFTPEFIRQLIDEGETPLEICLRFSWAPESLNEYYQNFVAAGWSEEDLTWFGLEATLDLEDENVPLVNGLLEDDNNTLMIIVIVGAVLVLGAATIVIAKKRSSKSK